MHENARKSVKTEDVRKEIAAAELLNQYWNGMVGGERMRAVPKLKFSHCANKTSHSFRTPSLLQQRLESSELRK